MKWTRHEVGCETHVLGGVCYICKKSLQILSYWHGTGSPCNTSFTVCLHCYNHNTTSMSIDDVVRRQYETEKAVESNALEKKLRNRGGRVEVPSGGEAEPPVGSYHFEERGGPSPNVTPVDRDVATMFRLTGVAEDLNETGSFLVPEEKVRFYMWKQRLIHWVQLVACLALLGGTGLGMNGIGGCLSVMAEREKTEYQVSGTCDNCKKSVSVWLKDGIPMGEGICPRCKVPFGDWR